MEYKILPFTIEEKDIQIDNDFFFFKGHGAIVDNVDLGNDRILPGAFTDTLIELQSQQKQLPALWQHKGSEPVGIYIDLKEDSIGLFVHGKLPKSDTFVSGRVIPQMQIGSVKELSIGFEALDWEMSGDIRIIKKIKLFEISLVTIAMNPLALITELKSKEIKDENDLKDMCDYIKKCYEKMGLESPFVNEAIEKIENISGFEERTLEKRFKSGVSFSNKLSKTLISVIKSAGLFRDEKDSCNRDGDEIAKLIEEIKEIDSLVKQRTI